MTPVVKQPWIALDRVDAIVQIEPAIFVVLLAALAWLAYIVLIPGVSLERHRKLRQLFKNLLGHIVIAGLAFGAYMLLSHFSAEILYAKRIMPYVGVFTAFEVTVMFIKTARIMTFIYLFRSHMSVGVPLLIVNLLTLLLSTILGLWLVRSVFGLDLGPFIATSAVFSIVLGLALQDTLGNLIAGVAMQFDSDKPYEIGDWVEIFANGTKWAGMVHEISWRATVLIGMGDEIITLPNRICAQSQVSNFSAKRSAFARSQIFRVRFGTSPEQVKASLLTAASSSGDVVLDPSPVVIISETSESWVSYKLVYYIADYGRQNIIYDHVMSAALKNLAAAGVELAPPRLELMANPHVFPTA